MNTGTRATSTFVLIFNLAAAFSALAQDSTPEKDVSEAYESSIMEEVTVTAMRREQHTNDISASLGAISGEDIRLLGMDTFEDYSRSQPGVSMHQPVKNRSTFNIRGINTDIGDTQLTQEPVAVYINDMPVTQAYAALVQVDLRLYDVDRIEILRGPQGTLFGSGTLGGLVRVITRQPELGLFEGSVRADWGSVDQAGFRQRYDGMVNIPLGDTVALRAVAYLRKEPGWVENDFLGTENSNDDWGGRMALLWQPNDRFSGKIEYLHQNSDPEDGDAWNPDVGKFKRDAIITEAVSYTHLTLPTNVQQCRSRWSAEP